MPEIITHLVSPVSSGAPGLGHVVVGVVLVWGWWLGVSSCVRECM